MTPADNYDRFIRSAFRLESLPEYKVAAESAEVAAFLRGEPLPERSVRTSPWLARIAATTIAGKSWSRVHVIDLPVSEYLRYEFAAYHANQAAGEQIRIAVRDQQPALADVLEDFWLFDAETDRPFGHRQLYSPDGTYLGAEAITDPDELARCAELKSIAWTASKPFNEFLAGSLT